jgi:polyribonucleotide nucleotidyltransferase
VAQYGKEEEEESASSSHPMRKQRIPGGLLLSLIGIAGFSYVSGFIGGGSSPSPLGGASRRLNRASSQQQRLQAHSIETDAETGKSVLTVEVAGTKLTFETGRIGRQAGGAVLSRDGDTILYTTACADSKTQDVDFVPLKVDYMERYSSAGLTSGGYNKRDGRASEKETLVSRLIDRPLRPMIDQGWTHETQLLSWVVSYDGDRQTDGLAITSTSAALCLSEVPLRHPVAGVTVGLDATGSFVVNPGKAVTDASSMQLTIAGTEDAILMIEGFCNFLSEERMVEAIQVGHEAVRTICQGLVAWQAAVGKPKRTDTLRPLPDQLKVALAEGFTEIIDAALQNPNKEAQSAAMSAVGEAVHEAFDEVVGEPIPDRYSKTDVGIALKKLWAERLRNMVLTSGRRTDGRSPEEVRPISTEVSILPRTHGSALFTRGETQAIATATLGGSSMRLKSDGLDGSQAKQFYLQYTFPPSCVGEVGRVGMPGRREIGHGNLAERALAPSIPPEDDFPYSVRVESLITESCGSSSMASVCGGSLSLMDAGVPVSSPIAGVAMGLLLDEDAMAAGVGSADGGSVILTDILGLEDALGTMDFKVAGNREGITAFQLDIKCEGLTIDLMKKALYQAREGRFHILTEMEKSLAMPRPEMSQYVPKFILLKVPQDSIGKIIGPGGKTIRSIIEDFGLEDVDIDPSGTICVLSMDANSNERAAKYIRTLVGEDSPGGPSRNSRAAMEAKKKELEVGKTYRGCVVKGIQTFGCFVELLPGVDGLLHVSELDSQRVRSVEGFVNTGDLIDVKLLSINEKGQLRLSRKAVLVEDAASAATAPAAEAQ